MGLRMASVRKQPNGKWQAQVARKGVRRSKLFATRQEARDWGARQEHLILNKETLDSRQTFGDLCLRFAREVSPLRKGEVWEGRRLKRFAADRIGAIAISDLTAAHFADWRDRRLLDVQPASVTREMNLMSSVLTQCRKEWGLISGNPLSDVRKPKQPPPRSRTATQEEIEALRLCAGPNLGLAMTRAFHAFLFACETAMRAGEIVGLTWDRVFLDQRYLHLPETKNGHPRDVPLSSEAMRLLKDLPRADPVFGLSSKSLDALWRKLRDKAAVEDLRFHDSRRIATVKLSKKLEPLELAKVTGHRDLNMLLNVYYATQASTLAAKLD
ncbi:MAG: site-specific integrase [Pseudomonadota bacterium]